MKRTILISNVDSYFGYSLAYDFLKRSTSGDIEFRLLCTERQLTSDLEKLGGKVFEVQNYKDKDKLNHLFRGVSYVILVPESSLQCYEEGCGVIECAKENNVNYMAMLSFVGMDKLKEKKDYLSQFQQLEHKIKHTFDKDSFCVFRSTLWHQFFYYFGPMIENENKIQLTLKDKTKWGTVDVSEVTEAIVQLSLEENCRENQTLFEFTPTNLMKTQQVVEAASYGLGISDMTYEKVDDSTLCNYFFKIHEDKRFKERPNPMFPLGQYLNHDLAQLMMEYLSLLDQLKEFDTTDDLEKAIKRHPLGLEDFFKDNKHQFHRLR